MTEDNIMQALLGLTEAMKLSNEGLKEMNIALHELVVLIKRKNNEP